MDLSQKTANPFFIMKILDQAAKVLADSIVYRQSRPRPVAWAVLVLHLLINWALNACLNCLKRILQASPMPALAAFAAYPWNNLFCAYGPVT